MCWAHSKCSISISYFFVDAMIMVIKFIVLCKICIMLREEGQKKKRDERGRKREKGRELNEKKKGLI